MPARPYEPYSFRYFFDSENLILCHLNLVTTISYLKLFRKYWEIAILLSIGNKNFIYYFTLHTKRVDDVVDWHKTSLVFID